MPSALPSPLPHYAALLIIDLQNAIDHPSWGQRNNPNAEGAGQTDLYTRCARDFGPALARLAAAYEANDASRQDLLQEIHAALWQSFRAFDHRCSLKTWVYRVAHNTAATHIRRAVRHSWITLDDAGPLPTAHDPDRPLEIERLMELVHRLAPLDRQVMLLYLEGQSAYEIADITGVSAANAATRIHRIKAVLTRLYHEGEPSNAVRHPLRMAGPALLPAASNP
jgi:RNA polymerase sigma-70 factor (ECF subfamily)